MVLKTISPGSGVRASLMLFLEFVSDFQTVGYDSHLFFKMRPYFDTDMLL